MEKEEITQSYYNSCSIAEKQADDAITRQEEKKSEAQTKEIKERHQKYAQKVFNSLLYEQDAVSAGLARALSTNGLTQQVNTQANTKIKDIQNHAEMKIYDTINIGPQLPTYIGISKLCCAGCMKAITSGEKNVVVRGAHFHNPQANKEKLRYNNPEGFSDSDGEQQNQVPSLNLNKLYTELISAQLSNIPYGDKA